MPVGVDEVDQDPPVDRNSSCPFQRVHVNIVGRIDSRYNSPVIAIPAIDLMNGRCVRLLKGSYRDVTQYDQDPVELAKSFEDAGVKRIHLVDLDAARGESGNRETLARIRQAVSCTLEVGGGIRTAEDAGELFDRGIDFAVVGTVFARSPDTVGQWVTTFGARFIAAVDAVGTNVRVHGWQAETQRTTFELASEAERVGIAALEYTDIDRDGAMQGPNIAATRALAEAAGVPVILSGGVSSEGDLFTIRAQAQNLFGVILGRAIYEGAVDVRRAVEILEGGSGP